MAGHLQLVGDNTHSSMWLAGALLSKDPDAAKAAAAELVEHLCKTPAMKRSSFEAALFEDKERWEALEAFSKQEVPTVLWGGRGRFAPLYRFLAVRYLANPDHVLDVERQHAVWQWVLARRRSLKLKSLNAWLKLGEHLRDTDALPPHRELLPHLTAIKQAFKEEYTAHLKGDALAKGVVIDHMYHERLGLSPEDVHLMKHGGADLGCAPPAAKTFDAVWSNFVRWTFVKGRFYSFPDLSPHLFLYVVENKSLAGREARAADEATGRSLVVTWFETDLDASTGDVIKRADRTSQAMRLSTLSIAEILAIAGGAPPTADSPSKEQELVLEARYAAEERHVWVAEHLWQHEDCWVFRVHTPEPAEASFLADTPPDKLSKMALARLLELKDGHDRRRAWTMTIAALLAALAGDKL